MRRVQRYVARLHFPVHCGRRGGPEGPYVDDDASEDAPEHQSFGEYLLGYCFLVFLPRLAHTLTRI
jgi:hypothetical protein